MFNNMFKVPFVLANDSDVSDFESEPEPKRVRTESESESGAQRVVVAPSMKQNYFNSWEHFEEEFQRYCEETRQLFRYFSCVLVCVLYVFCM